VADALGRDSVNRVDLRFGTDFQGNLYITTKQDGFVRQLVSVPEPSFALTLLFATMGLVGVAATKGGA